MSKLHKVRIVIVEEKDLQVGTILVSKFYGWESEVTDINLFSDEDSIHLRYKVRDMWLKEEEIREKYAIML